jgi:hypothetical protein
MKMSTRPVSPFASSTMLPELDQLVSPVSLTTVTHAGAPTLDLICIRAFLPTRLTGVFVAPPSLLTFHRRDREKLFPWSTAIVVVAIALPPSDGAVRAG